MEHEKLEEAQKIFGDDCNRFRKYVKEMNK